MTVYSHDILLFLFGTSLLFQIGTTAHKRGRLRRHTSAAKRSCPTSEVGGEAESARLRQRRSSHPMSEVRGSGREEQPHVQGAVAAPAQEGLEELFHVQGQKQWC